MKIIATIALSIFLLSSVSYSQTDTTTQEKEQVYARVEQMPSYIRGNSMLLKDIVDCIVYPKEALEIEITGVVVVRVTITTKGVASDAQILKSVHPLLDQAALDVIPLLGNFNPGMQGGKPVAVYYNIPIKFEMPK